VEPIKFSRVIRASDMAYLIRLMAFLMYRRWLSGKDEKDVLEKKEKKEGKSSTHFRHDFNNDIKSNILMRVLFDQANKSNTQAVIP
jgi:hypothetical protein